MRSHECGIADIISGKRLQGADADNVMLHLEVLAVEISGNKEHYK